ncbi:MazG nucleotide pyrophosphohydrolase domain-containing protein [Sphingomonas sp.]|uniref:MazG nucleotide pyrophosphohydrolase domain-containing protein n=1 Tax=Sphingomonas sp. TaxID=28214 RepID=UPI003B3B7BE2
MSALDPVAPDLPALSRADLISRRAAVVGFDWDDAAGARAKVLEELAEVEAARTPEERTDELGDLLFAVVNWARKLGIEPEAALHQATSKFERRFRTMEQHAGVGLPGLTLDQMEQHWQAAKRETG